MQHRKSWWLATVLGSQVIRRLLPMHLPSIGSCLHREQDRYWEAASPMEARVVTGSEPVPMQVSESSRFVAWTSWQLLSGLGTPLSHSVEVSRDTFVRSLLGFDSKLVPRVITVGLEVFVGSLAAVAALVFEGLAPVG